MQCTGKSSNISRNDWVERDVTGDKCPVCSRHLFNADIKKRKQITKSPRTNNRGRIYQW